MRIRRDSRAFILLLGVLAGLPAMSMDLSAPTLPLLPAELGTSATIAGFSITAFMFGFAAGQFIGGRTSDLYGRRPVLLCAIALSVLSGAACALAGTGLDLALARAVQGAAAGACAVQAVAVVQDLFTGELARQRQSYVTVILSIAPMLAPALGTVLVAAWGWRSVYWTLCICGAGLGVVLWAGFDETRPARGPVKIVGPMPSGRILRDRAFRSLVLANACSYASLFAYIAGAPMVMVSWLGYSQADYALLFAITACALASGAAVSGLLGRINLGGIGLVWAALTANFAACITLALLANRTNAPGLLLPPLVIACFTRGIASPNLIHLGVSRHRDNAGLAAALVGVALLLMATLSSAVVAVLVPIGGLAGTATPMAVFSGLAIVVWLTEDVIRRRVGAET